MKLIQLLLLFSLFLSCNPVEKESAAFTKGVYGNPAALLDAGYRFDSLGMNAVFVRSISLNQDFYKTAKEQGVKVYVEFPTLNGKEYLQDHSEAWPITEKGEKAEPADWFMGICPTDPGFKKYRSDQLREILQEYDVDGIFLDYVHWHAQFETKNPILPETCFCDRCTAQFGKSINKEIPGNLIADKAGWILENQDPAWRKWRAEILNGWVEEMGAITNEMRPEAKLGVFYCAWYPNDYDSALYRNLGIDPLAFSKIADVLSPMLFHQMKERPTTWVGEYVTWLGDLVEIENSGSKPGDLNQRFGPQIWPIVQSHNNPGIISPEEFKAVMLEGSKSPATGIMMFSDQSLVENPEKVKVMKKLYRVEIK
jgi:hypothetical protein